MKKKRLGDVCRFIGGGTPSKKKKEYYSGNIPWATVRDMNTRLLSSTEFRITNDAVQESATNVIPGGEVVISTHVGLGKVCVLAQDTAINQDLKAVVPTTGDIDRWYLYHWVVSQADLLVSAGTGATVKGVTLQFVGNLEIPFPDLPVQRRIAAALDLICELKRNAEERLAKLDLFAKSLFVEMFGDMAIERRWPRVRLSSVCSDPDDIKCGPFGTQLSKAEYRSSGTAVWEIPQINTQCEVFPERFVSREKAKELAAYSVVAGDIVMSRKGNVGKCALFPSKWPAGIIHSDVLRIRVDKSRIEPVFMMAQLHYSRDIEHQISLVSSGAVMAGVNVTKLKNIFVETPPLSLQRAFAERVECIDRAKANLRETIDRLDTLYRSKLQEYFG